MKLACGKWMVWSFFANLKSYIPGGSMKIAFPFFLILNILPSVAGVDVSESLE